MNLFLMRHATAEPHEDETQDVPLLPLGKAEARLMGRWLRSTGYRIDVVLCSDLKRSHQTAKRMANRVHAPLVVFPCLGPNNDPETAWKAILKAAGDETHVLVVTHGPLIQDLRDWLVGNPGTSWQDQHWAYGCIHHLKDGREHWAVAPHMIARTLGEETKLQESPTLAQTVGDYIGDVGASLELVENLKRANKARIVDPLIKTLATMLRRRFRQQQRKVVTAIKSAFRESDASSARQAAAGAMAAYSSAQWLAAYKRASQGAWAGGVAIAIGQLDAAESLDFADELAGPERTAALAAEQLDETTIKRLMNAITDDMSQADIFKAVSGVFNSAVSDRAEPAALHEVSSAFHDGMLDAADKISLDSGDDVEKLWAIEDTDACEDCQDAFDEDWVDMDFVYPSIGGTDPGDAHPNCRCSLDLRRAEKP